MICTYGIRSDLNDVNPRKVHFILATTYGDDRVLDTHFDELVMTFQRLKKSSEIRVRTFQ